MGGSKAILEIMIEVESRMAEFYHQLSDLLGDAPELQTLWRELQEEEVEHAANLLLLKDYLESTGRSLNPLPIREKALKAVLAELDRCETLVEEGTLTPREAIALAESLELSEANACYRGLINAVDGPVPEILSSMSLGLQDHLMRLQSARERLPEGTPRGPTRKVRAGRLAVTKRGGGWSRGRRHAAYA